MPNSRKQPKLKISKTKGEWFWDIIGYLFFFGSIIFLVSVWGNFQKKFPDIMMPPVKSIVGDQNGNF
ncbi:hypothetical protein AB434_1766 [Heyndrickxia coagulans]|nr:hypothetical protein Bcoa_0808 [Heyndrickxia coagulans 36D1]AKN54171.1 hypothetical protein AB434_1766 [Heyndrickxia coagulans]